MQRFLPIVKVTSYKEYVNLPKKDRTRFGFWYLEPEALSLEDWEAIEVHFKIEYPIQYRFREFIDDVCMQRYQLKRWWHENVVCRIRPRNKWIAKIVPCTWADKTWLIEKFLFECIVHYVEVELKESKHLMEPGSPFEDKWKRIEKCYTYITVDRPNMQQEIDELMEIAYPPGPGLIGMSAPDRKEAQNKILELENIMHTITCDTLKEIIDLKQHLWT